MRDILNQNRMACRCARGSIQHLSLWRRLKRCKSGGRITAICLPERTSTRISCCAARCIARLAQNRCAQDGPRPNMTATPIIFARTRRVTCMANPFPVTGLKGNSRRSSRPSSRHARSSIWSRACSRACSRGRGKRRRRVRPCHASLRAGSRKSGEGNCRSDQPSHAGQKCACHQCLRNLHRGTAEN